MTKPISRQQWRVVKSFRNPKTGAIDLNALRREVERFVNFAADDLSNPKARRETREIGKRLRKALAALERLEI
ncbi:hypothetical protein AB3G45_15375 [Shinella sp. S4-D37]|uniref:hypothetical protein n=1 Tax=Shinella sp. S4-D37 TaxID=3161999 RepID=UPI0034674025